MSANFTYNGIPIEKDGVVVAVQPVRGIEHTDGKTYYGVVGTDASGNEFAYRRVPDSGVESVRYQLVDSEGYALLDSDGNRLLVKG